MPLTEKGEKILHNMQEQNGAKAGESEFYASKNAGTISGVDSFPSNMDAVPLGKCYQDDVSPAVMSGDPVISPTSTSQYSGMQEQLRTAPQPGPVEPVDAAGPEQLRHVIERSKREIASSTTTTRQKELARQTIRHAESILGEHEKSSGGGPGVRHDPKNGQFSGDTPPLSDLDAFARLGAGGDAWSEMTGRHDFSGDGNSSMGNLPEQVGFGEIKRMGAGFNYNQGYNGDPYKR